MRNSTKVVSKPPRQAGRSHVSDAVSSASGASPSSAPIADPKARPAFEFWDLPQEAKVRELPASHVTEAARQEISELLSAGSDDEFPGHQELFVVIGLDFGTSSTKVVVRFPYESGQPAIAIPAPGHCLSDGHAYLWQTVLWLRPNGEFITWPEPGAVLLQTLKQGVMHSGAENPVVDGEFCGLQVSRLDAATAYLAFVIRYARGWLRTHRSDMVRGRSTKWLLNLGLPAEQADNSELSATYRQIATTALLCANHSDKLDVETTKLWLIDEVVGVASESASKALELGIGVFPETVAEAVGFTKSKLASLDLYLMVDVGASTLDVCTFRLHAWHQGTYQYSLQCGMVRPLGVEAMHWFLNEGRTEVAFREQCDRSLWRVLGTTLHTKDPNARGWQAGNDLPVFLVGGGARNALHLNAVHRLTDWLKQHTKSNGIRLVELPTPKGLDTPVPVEDFGRLAVAWGLSFPEDEIGDVVLPSASTDVEKPRPMSIQDNFVSKDQV